MKDSKGYSLLEIMMALVILSVGLLALVQMQGVFAEGSGDARYITRAMNAGMTKMEELKLLPYGDALLSAGAHNQTVNTYSKPLQVGWRVTNITTNSKRIEVTVSWDSGSDSKSIQLTGVRSRVE